MWLICIRTVERHFAKHYKQTNKEQQATMPSSLSGDPISPSPEQENLVIVTCKNVASCHRYSID